MLRIPSPLGPLDEQAPSTSFSPLRSAFMPTNGALPSDASSLLRLFPYIASWRDAAEFGPQNPRHLGAVRFLMAGGITMSYDQYTTTAEISG